MTSVLVRPVVEAFGERGHISLPLVEQLLPVVSTADLELLGAPAWIPWLGVFQLGAVAAQRSAVEFQGTKGAIIVIESMESIEDMNVALRAGGGLGTGPTGVWASDLRRWPEGGVGVLRIASVATQGIGTIAANYTTVWNLRATFPSGRNLTHPIYLAGENQIALVYGEVDNTGQSLWVRGRYLTRQ